MGHLIVGRMPNTLAWRAVVAHLGGDELAVPKLASLTSKAAQDRLIALRGDPSLTYCFWLLTRLAAASRGENFPAAVRQLGIDMGPDDSALQFIARVSDRARLELNRFPESGPFGAIASLSLRHALVETVGQEGRSLFGNALEDLERSFRRHSTASQFGELAERFFGDFMGRTLRFYVDRALPSAVGAGPLATTADASAFSEALTAHTRRTASVVEDFAAGWYSKRQFEQMGLVGREDVEPFVAYALDKMRRAIKQEGAT